MAKYPIDQFLVGRALEEGRRLFGDKIEGWQTLEKSGFRKKLAEMPVPQWIELGVCENSPWDGHSGYCRLAFKEEVLDLLKAWVEKIEKGGV